MSKKKIFIMVITVVMFVSLIFSGCGKSADEKDNCLSQKIIA